MKLWLVIPVKPFKESKSRLHHILDAAQRAALSRRLLGDVLTTIMEFTQEADGQIAGVLVISRDGGALQLAKEVGAVTMPEQGADLNAALEEARQQVIRFGADALLILPSDLPLLTIDDLRSLHTLAVETRGLVIAPSRDGGTNALLVRPPNAIDFAFGPDSFERHQQFAHVQNYPCYVLESASLAFDIDWPEDLNELAVLEG